MKAGILLCAIAISLPGCSSNDDAAGEQTPKTVLDPQLEAIEKARAVDRQIEDAAARQRRAIEEHGG